MREREREMKEKRQIEEGRKIANITNTRLYHNKNGKLYVHSTYIHMHEALECYAMCIIYQTKSWKIVYMFYLQHLSFFKADNLCLTCSFEYSNSMINSTKETAKP